MDRLDPDPALRPDGAVPVTNAIGLLVDAVVGRAAIGDALEALQRQGLADAGALADRAYRARAEHARLRRRDRELSVLFSSARELAELRDADTVLARLVQRAHQMMGADLTYLSEFIPANGELRVRESAGSVSPSLQTVPVPPGRGLGGSVVETRSPQWAARYTDWARERHDEALDEVAAAEGIVSLLGVPMLSGDDVLGVLCVANREPYVFTPEEIALLSALADHASVVLQTARTLRDLRESEDGTRRALEALTEHLAERDRSNTVHEELVRAVLAGGGFAPVAATLASALDAAVTIVDAREQTLAASGRPPAHGAPGLDDAVREAVAESRRTGQCVVLPGEAVRAVVAMTAGAHHFGAVLLGRDGAAPSAVDRRTMERAAQVGALLALQQESLAAADHRARSELVADLLDDVPERRPDVARRALRQGVALDELDALVLLSVPGEHRAAAARALAPLLGERALLGEHRGFVVAADASSRLPADAERLRAHVARALQQPVLAVVPPLSPGALPEAFRTAVRTARLLASLGVDDVATSTDRWLPYAAVLDTDARALSEFLHGTIGAVRRYDEERGTDLVGTLRSFVRSGASPTRTARDLRFHTNTILQRLERLDHVLGGDWRDDERLFRIGLAVRLDELRERVLRPGVPA